jgi:hypothetical protein
MLGPPTTGKDRSSCEVVSRSCVAANVKEGMRYVSKEIQVRYLMVVSVLWKHGYSDKYPNVTAERRGNRGEKYANGTWLLPDCPADDV